MFFCAVNSAFFTVNFPGIVFNRVVAYYYPRDAILELIIGTQTELK